MMIVRAMLSSAVPCQTYGKLPGIPAQTTEPI
jgi:hypothetical protein